MKPHAAAMVRALIATKGSATIRLTGKSMAPYLEEGDLAVVARAEYFSVGAIYVYARLGDGGIVAHRMVGEHPGGIVVKGDHARFKEIAPAEAILGEVVGVNRGDGRVVKVGCSKALSRSAARLSIRMDRICEEMRRDRTALLLVRHRIVAAEIDAVGLISRMVDEMRSVGAEVIYSET